MGTKKQQYVVKMQAAAKEEVDKKNPGNKICPGEPLRKQEKPKEDTVKGRISEMEDCMEELMLTGLSQRRKNKET